MSIGYSTPCGVTSPKRPQAAPRDSPVLRRKHGRGIVALHAALLR